MGWRILIASAALLLGCRSSEPRLPALTDEIKADFETGAKCVTSPATTLLRVCDANWYHLDFVTMPSGALALVSVELWRSEPEQEAKELETLVGRLVGEKVLSEIRDRLFAAAAGETVTWKTAGGFAASLRPANSGQGRELLLMATTDDLELLIRTTR